MTKTKPWKEIAASRPDTPERQAANEAARREMVGEIVTTTWPSCAR